MKCNLFGALLIFFLNNLHAQNKFTPLLQENFDSLNIDYSCWSNNYSWGRTIIANKELQYYTDGSNFELKNGHLIITAKKEHIKSRVSAALPDDYVVEDSLPNLRPFSYTSGMLRSLKKFQ